MVSEQADSILAHKHSKGCAHLLCQLVSLQPVYPAVDSPCGVLSLSLPACLADLPFMQSVSPAAFRGESVLLVTPNRIGADITFSGYPHWPWWEMSANESVYYISLCFTPFELTFVVHCRCNQARKSCY